MRRSGHLSIKKKDSCIHIYADPFFNPKLSARFFPGFEAALDITSLDVLLSESCGNGLAYRSALDTVHDHTLALWNLLAPGFNLLRIAPAHLFISGEYVNTAGSCTAYRTIVHTPATGSSVFVKKSLHQDPVV